MSQSVLIVGAGVFGASTALHLSRSRPDLSITLIDRTPFPNPSAASIPELDVWKKDPLFSQHYHKCGMLSILPHKGGATTILNNLKQLGIDSDAKVLTPEEVKEGFDKVFAHADYANIKEFLWDPAAAWADAPAALSATIKAAIDNGVKYIPTGISKLCISSEGICTGVQLADNTLLTASHVLLSAGAATATILADSAPHDPSTHAAHRFVAAAITVAKVKLTPALAERYKSLPAVMWDAEPVRGETMPPTRDGYMKFIRDIPLANTMHHLPSGTQISVPPSDPSATQWTAMHNIPQPLQDEIRTTITGLFGTEAAKDLLPAIEQVRLCWEPLAPDENWFVTPHTRCRNLYIATAGSGHGWKFLPVLGEYVGQMMMDPDSWQHSEYREMWSWDRKLEDTPDEDIIPQREYRDLTESKPA